MRVSFFCGVFWRLALGGMGLWSVRIESRFRFFGDICLVLVIRVNISEGCLFFLCVFLSRKIRLKIKGSFFSNCISVFLRVFIIVGVG